MASSSRDDFSGVVIVMAMEAREAEAHAKAANLVRRYRNAFGDMFATLYHSLGLTPETTVPDPTGRPQHVCEGERIRELV